MKKTVKLTLILTLLSMLTTNLGHALDLDASVDDEIRKNYNPNKLVEDSGINHSALEKNIKADILEEQAKAPDENLPELPKILNSTKKSDITGDTITPKTTYIPYRGGNIRVHAGTSFNVVNLTGISDWQSKGTKVTFNTKKNIYGRNYSIPAGTKFEGEIVEVHQPQLSCNGGLVVILVKTMIYKNQRIHINAYVTRANDKKIFFNNIKGQRTYLKTMWKKGNWGRELFGKMCTLSVGLGATGATIVLTPFPFAYGTICLGASAITSPITALFSKGQHLSIPANSNFRIKLTEDILLN